MPMHNPAHPGEIIRELILSAEGLTVAATALRLGTSRKTLHKILSGNSPISVDMALKLEAAFPGPDAAHWLRLQSAYDLWHARQVLAEEKRAA